MQLDELENTLNYTFKNRKYLEEAIRHSSYVNEHPHLNIRDNERLEFLGDAVLNLVISHLLMKNYPDMPEGSLSKIRAGLVNEIRLALLAKEIRLGGHLMLGKGEKITNGHRKNSILADALEAVIAAIYMDGGYTAAFTFIEDLFAFLISDIDENDNNKTDFDYKSRIQEIVQNRYGITPTYEIIEERGPDHDKTFTVRILFLDLGVQGVGKSKKAAEQDAAKNALQLMENPFFTLDAG